MSCMDDQNLYWIWLSRRPRLGPVKLRQLLELVGAPAAIYAAEAEALTRLGLSASARNALLDKDLNAARAILRSCQELGITILPLWSEAYPSALRQAPDAPVLLYCRGTLPPAGRQPWIALVGAREADDRGLRTAERLGREIAACGGVTVTGMARGVDAFAARGALEQGGPVVGVLGCGADVVYPPENAGLFAQVAEQGCLISEYPPGVQPNARHFPARNRIISGLSDGVVVAQASERSGALITARWAAEQGRDVFAVPGPAGEPLSRGCNQLLRDGAALAETGWDVLREYEFRYPGAVRMQNAKCKMQNEASPVGAAIGRPPEASAADTDPSVGAAIDRPPEVHAAELDLSALAPVQRQIAEALLNGPLQLDSLIDKTGLPASQILPQLTVLQIKKLISQKPGKIYKLSGG